MVNDEEKNNLHVDTFEFFKLKCIIKKTLIIYREYHSDITMCYFTVIDLFNWYKVDKIYMLGYCQMKTPRMNDKFRQTENMFRKNVKSLQLLKRKE